MPPRAKMDADDREREGCYCPVMRSFPLSRTRFRSVPSTATLALICVAALAIGCSSPDDDPVGAAGTGGSPAGTAGAGTAGSGTGGSGTAGSGMGGVDGSSGGATGGSTAAGSGGAAGGAAVGVALCPEGSLFCDDFEDAAAGALTAPWRTSVNQATVNVDAVQAFSGTQAVHVNAPQEGTYHRGYFALDQSNYPGAEQEMYGRAMVYLADYTNAAVHWTFIQGEGRAADNTHNALYRYGGQHQNGAQLMANYETTPPVATDCWDHSASVLPKAEWTCVEWHFTVATNDMQFWMNDTEISDIHVTDRGEGCVGQALAGQWLAPPAFETLYLGWEHYQQSVNPIDVWMDDVVVDTKRVGCPAPQ
jgi:hypothetical protein